MRDPSCLVVHDGIWESYLCLMQEEGEGYAIFPGSRGSLSNSYLWYTILAKVSVPTTNRGNVLSPKVVNLPLKKKK